MIHSQINVACSVRLPEDYRIMGFFFVCLFVKKKANRVLNCDKTGVYLYHHPFCRVGQTKHKRARRFNSFKGPSLGLKPETRF